MELWIVLLLNGTVLALFGGGFAVHSTERRSSWSGRVSLYLFIAAALSLLAAPWAALLGG